MMNATIEQTASGKTESLAKLVAEHYPAVFRFCAHRVGPELAQDAAQETFLTVQKRMGRFENRSSFKTWLLGIAHNHCRNLARKQKMEISFSGLWATDTPEPATPGESRLIDRQALRSALLSLSQEHREAVVMHEVEGLTYEEIGTILNVPAGTVKSRLHHAFSILRQKLTAKEGMGV